MAARVLTAFALAASLSLPAPFRWIGPDPIPSARASRAAPPVAGRIEGRVEVRERPARRIPNRYPGAASGAARPVQVLPTVVYLEGAVPGAAAPSSAVMAQRDTVFSPGTVIVGVGGTVSFPNQDGFFHNVFSYSPAQRFDLGRYPRGESKSVRFEKAGVVKVYCEVHEFMRAAVIVTENPFHAQVAADGTFAIPDVPPGEYTLVAWHVDLGEARTRVRVTDGAAARVSLTLQ